MKEGRLEVGTFRAERQQVGQLWVKSTTFFICGHRGFQDPEVGLRWATLVDVSCLNACISETIVPTPLIFFPERQF